MSDRSFSDMAAEGDADTSSAEETKDFWDKLEASGAVVGGLLVALIGAFATVVYNTRQQRAADQQAAQQLSVNRVQTLGQLMPFLASTDSRQLEAALVSIAELGDPELAASMAAIYRAEGGAQALERLANSPDREAARTARATLASFFDEVRDAVAWVERDGQFRGLAVFVAPHLLATLTFVLKPQGVETQEDVNRELRIRHVGVATEAHVAVVGAEQSDISILKSEAAGVPLRLGSSSSLAIGDVVTVAGPSATLSGSAELAVESARIDGLTEGGLLKLVDIRLARGSAGAPVIDASGALVGMAAATNDFKTRAGGQAVPVETIREALLSATDP